MANGDATTADLAVKQALAESLHLLNDIEDKIRSPLGIQRDVPIVDIRQEQLQPVPPQLLAALDSTMQVVVELRKQLSIGSTPQQPATSMSFPAASCIYPASGPGSSTQAAAGSGPQARHDNLFRITSKGTDESKDIDGRIASATSSQHHFSHSAGTLHRRQQQGINTITTARQSSASLSRSIKQHSVVRGSTSKVVSASSEFHTPKTPAAAQLQDKMLAAATEAARSSLFSSAATQQARVEWLAGKEQKRQAAAAAMTRELQKEQVLLQRLQEKRAAAHTAHLQAMQEIRQLQHDWLLLQLLDSADDQWAAYLVATKQQLQERGADEAPAERL